MLHCIGPSVFEALHVTPYTLEELSVSMHQRFNNDYRDFSAPLAANVQCSHLDFPLRVFSKLKKKKTLFANRHWNPMQYWDMEHVTSFVMIFEKTASPIVIWAWYLPLYFLWQCSDHFHFSFGSAVNCKGYSRTGLICAGKIKTPTFRNVRATTAVWNVTDCMIIVFVFRIWVICYA